MRVRAGISPGAHEEGPGFSVAFAAVRNSQHFGHRGVSFSACGSRIADVPAIGDACNSISVVLHRMLEFQNVPVAAAMPR